MKNVFRLSGVILLILSIFLIHSCKKKEEVPVITTTAVSNITATTATSGGNITSEGSSTVISRGVFWSTGTTPTIADNKTTDGAGAGSFSSSLTVLNGATNYYVRAYASNIAGTGYGMALSFSTLGQSPTSAGVTATNINVTSATLNGSVNANYLSTVVIFEYGTTTGYGSTATPSQSPITGNTSSNVSADITGLNAGTIYHYRMKSVNSLGTTNSNDIAFTTLGLVPTVTTLAATNISATGSSLNGTVNSNYLSTVVTFEYGATMNYGNSVTATPSSITGNSITNVSTSVTGLTAGTTYHFRIKAVNSLGTTYSTDMTFVTIGETPTVTAMDVTNITSWTATLNGTVNANYLPTEASFEYGTTTSYGNSVTAIQSPITGNAITNVSANISGLLPVAIYHFRIKAINSLGIFISNDMTFTTVNWAMGSMVDVDGNTYNTIQIGTQVWMKENLKTTKYRNGDIIGTTTPATLDITAQSTPKYQWAYDGNESNVNTYGRLYTWFAATDTRNLCPTGWRLPSKDEWKTFEDYLIANGYNYDGTTSGNKIAKALASNTLWLVSSTVGAPGNTDYPLKINISGFTGLPSGVRNPSGLFGNILYHDSWWSYSEDPSKLSWAYYRQLFFDNIYSEYMSHDKMFGQSVRCLKDY